MHRWTGEQAAPLAPWRLPTRAPASRSPLPPPGPGPRALSHTGATSWHCAERRPPFLRRERGEHGRWKRGGNRLRVCILQDQACHAPALRWILTRTREGGPQGKAAADVQDALRQKGHRDRRPGEQEGTSGCSKYQERAATNQPYVYISKTLFSFPS